MAIKRIIKIKRTSKRISGFGGIFLYDEILNKFNLGKSLEECFPVNKIQPKSTSFEKFKALMLGFIAGTECLDDMERLRFDDVFTNLVPMNAANVYGDYLRAFTGLQAKELNFKLMDMALKLRNSTHPNKKEFILDIDSTPHEQYGKKMEGLEWNYKNIWCLDSINAYDELGYQYYSGVRKGSTYSSNGAPEIIHQVFKRVSKKLKKQFRGDSAFCNVDCFMACYNAGVKFAIAMKANMYNPLLKNITKWEKIDNSKREKKNKFAFYDGRDCELGHTIYYPEKGAEVLRVTVIRALKEDKQNALFNVDNYDYFAVVSNIGQHEMKDEKLIKFYRKRGNAENFIKESKYGFDLKHFPCEKLTANKVYGVIAAFAYNLTRYTAHIMGGKRIAYAKRIRFLLVYLPCQIIKHARSIIFRFNERIYKEVMRVREKIYKSLSLVFEN